MAVGRAYLPDMRPPKIRLRLKRPPMSGKASPTYIGFRLQFVDLL
jgi:hypothetical protein